MTFDWDQLEIAVSDAIQSGKLGLPRALRVTLHITGGDSASLQLSEAVMSAGTTWFGGEPTSKWEKENGTDLHVIMARWPNSSSALVSISRAQEGKSGGDFTLLCSGGAIYHRLSGTPD